METLLLNELRIDDLEDSDPRIPSTLKPHPDSESQTIVRRAYPTILATAGTSTPPGACDEDK